MARHFTRRPKRAIRPAWDQAGTSEAAHVFNQNDGDITKAYYALLATKGAIGELAVALFRAQKRSAAAKSYRRREHTQSAYDVKNWSMEQVCKALTNHPFPITWGWKDDPATKGYEHVLYVDLPTGQASFHSPTRLCAKEYPGRWDGTKRSAENVLRFCDLVMAGVSFASMTPALTAKVEAVAEAQMLEGLLL